MSRVLRFSSARWINFFAFACVALTISVAARAQDTAKPALHGKHWVAVTGKPLGATAGAMTFTRGGNAVDAACAMLAATATQTKKTSRKANKVKRKMTKQKTTKRVH